MSETKFLVRYSVNEGTQQKYLKLLKEFKSLIRAEGLVDYSVYVDAKNKLSFTEVYTFKSEEAFDNYEDDSDERTKILMSKMAEFVVNKTTKYSVIKKVEFETGDK